MTIIRSAAELGAEIRARRKALGYTQAFFAEYAGISASFLSELENGKETVQINKLMRVVSLLGMDLYVAARGE